jgi:hypothetical protein
MSKVKKRGSGLTERLAEAIEAMEAELREVAASNETATADTQSTETVVADETAAATANTQSTEVAASNETATAVAADETANVKKYVDRYKEIDGTMRRKNAETYLQLSGIVIEAKEKLSEVQFDEFCVSVGINPNPKSSMLRRIMKIGTRAERFVPHMDKLTGDWTTIADLAALEPLVFDQVVKDERFGPSMTGKVLREITGKTPAASTRARNSATPVGPHDFAFHTEKLPEQAIGDLYLQAVDLAERVGCKWSIGKALRQALQLDRKKAA